MKHDNRKIALIGTGMVGMSYAYSQALHRSRAKQGLIF